MAGDRGAPNPQVARLVWGSFLAALAAYALLAIYVVRPAGAGAEGVQRVLMLLAVATAAVVVLMHRRLADAHSGTWPPESAAAQALFTRYTVVWALTEAIGLYGLVLRFLGGDASVALGLIAASAALLIHTRPRV